MFKQQLRRLIKAVVPKSRRGLPRPVDFPAGIRVQSPRDTLDVCRRHIEAGTQGAYLRFGDGDVNLLWGRKDKLQTATPRFAEEMREAFSLTGPGIMKCLPLHSPRFGIWPGMAPGIFGASDEWAVKLLSACHYYFIGTPIYTNIALSYLAVFDQPAALGFLRFLKACAPPLFVGNQNVPADILAKLFGPIARVATPERDSYVEMEAIEKAAMGHIRTRGDQFHVVVVSMGCAGRVFAKRILTHDANVFLFDYGSLLDAFCGWGSRKWISLAPGDVRQLLDEL